ncbi:MAG: fibronectin type III domain-containing protein [Chitinophagaceae bacterium]|nr:fibronectin type III domain-containing protein [Chitinophagaceae bacterium]
MRHLITISLFLISFAAIGQAPTSIYEEITNTNGTLGTWTMLPASYNGTNKYPALVFFPGSGEIGTGTFSTDSTRIYRNGPLRARKQGYWDGYIKFQQLDGSYVDTPCIVIGMQPRLVTTSRLYTRHVDSVLKRYAVDTMRLVVTGLSMGGQLWNQVLMSHSNSVSPTITYDHYTMWSAALIFSTPGPTSGATVSDLRFWLDKGGYYYYGIGQDDGGSYVRASTLDSLKNAYPGQMYTAEYPGEDHCCWNNRYFQPAVYDSAGTRDKYPKALAEATINTTGTSVTIHGKIAGYVAVAQWAQNSGPNSATVTPNSDTTATISGLVNGTYKIRLRSRNGNGSSASYFDWETTIIKTTPGDKPPAKKITTRKKGQKVNMVKE